MYPCRKKATRKQFVEVLEAEGRLGTFDACAGGDERMVVLEYDIEHHDDDQYAQMKERGYLIFIHMWRHRVYGKKQLVHLYPIQQAEEEGGRGLGARRWNAITDAKQGRGVDGLQEMQAQIVRLQAQLLELQMLGMGRAMRVGTRKPVVTIKC